MLLIDILFLIMFIGSGALPMFTIIIIMTFDLVLLIIMLYR